MRLFGLRSSRGITLVLGLVLASGAALPTTSWASPAAASNGIPMPLAWAGPATDKHEGPPFGTPSIPFTSRNWDGYGTYDASEGTDFNEVEATWVQPAVTCEAASAWTVFWVGLDGFWNDTVEQGGSEAYCPTAGGTPLYFLWWEMYPTNSIQTTLEINAGDTIDATVTYEVPTAQFVINVRDKTSHASMTEVETCAAGLTCSRSSAEVIAEPPGYGNGLFLPLADYGTMTFAQVKVTGLVEPARSLSGTDWLNGTVTESDGATTYATVSPLYARGTAFDATWQHQ